MRAGSSPAGSQPSVERIREWLSVVTDPEIPVLTIEDLGVLQDIAWDGETVVVTITPTYSGCPAMLTIRTDIVAALRAQGLERIRVIERNAPAWTTDWLSEAGRRKLQAFGIAPPAGQAGGKAVLFGAPPQPACPQCGSAQTTLLSEFGSTPCKALYRCERCLEPFDYFKCI